MAYNSKKRRETKKVKSQGGQVIHTGDVTSSGAVAPHRQREDSDLRRQSFRDLVQQESGIGGGMTSGYGGFHPVYLSDRKMDAQGAQGYISAKAEPGKQYIQQHPQQNWNPYAPKQPQQPVGNTGYMQWGTTQSPEFNALAELAKTAGEARSKTYTEYMQERRDALKRDQALNLPGFGMRYPSIAAQEYGRQQAGGELEEDRDYIRRKWAANQADPSDATRPGGVAEGDRIFKGRGVLARDDRTLQNALMTDEQRQTYYYIYGTQGREEAERFRQTVLDAGDQGGLNAQIAQRAYEVGGKHAEGIPRLIGNTAAGAVGAADRALDNIAGVKDVVTGNPQYRPTSTAGFYADTVQRDAPEGSAERMLYELSQTAATNAPAYLAGIAGGPAVGRTVFAIQAGASAYNESLKEGHTVGEATAYGAMQALDEEITGWLLGGLAGMSGGVAQKAIGRSAVGQMVSQTLQGLMQTEGGKYLMRQLMEAFGNGMGEAAQEYLQHFTEQFEQWIAYNHDNYTITTEEGRQNLAAAAPTLEEAKKALLDPQALHEALLGFLNAGLMNAPGQALEAADIASRGRNSTIGVQGYGEFADSIDVNPLHYSNPDTYQAARDLRGMANEYAARNTAGMPTPTFDRGIIDRAAEEFADRAAQDPRQLARTAYDAGSLEAAPAAEGRREVEQQATEETAREAEQAVPETAREAEQAPPAEESVEKAEPEAAPAPKEGLRRQSFEGFTPAEGPAAEIDAEINLRRQQAEQARDRQRRIAEGTATPSYHAAEAPTLEGLAQVAGTRQAETKESQRQAIVDAAQNLDAGNLAGVMDNATMLTEAEKQAAYQEGKTAAVTQMRMEAQNGREQRTDLPGGGSARISSVSAGEQAGGVSAETEAVRRIWRAGKTPADPEAANLRIQRKARAEEVIPDAKPGSTVFIPANKTEAMKRGEAQAGSYGLKVVSWAGQAVSSDGVRFRGETIPGTDTIYAQADNRDFTQDKIINHEIAENRLSQEEFEDIISEAREASPDVVNLAIGIYQDFSGESEYKAAKELVCDANGMMNQFERLAKQDPDTYQDIRDILQEAIEAINPIVSKRLEGKRQSRPAATSKAASVNNSTEHSVEFPYKFGSAAAQAWLETLKPEARKTADMFAKLHDIGLHNKARVMVGVGEGRHRKLIDVTTRNMLASEWNEYISTEPAFANTARMLAEALPDRIRKEAHIDKDGRVLATPFENRYKMMRSFMQRIVDALPGGTMGNKTLVNGKEVTISKEKTIPSIGGEEYRKALLEERRKQYRQGTLAKKSISGLSKDTWGTMGFLAANTKTTASGDFTTFCPQMHYGNGGCWYCYRLSALRSGVNNKLVGENVWYTGEILRLKQEDIDSLNRNGGLRIQSFGDWMEQYTPQLLDMLVDAETVGLQIKIITKEPSMIDAVALLRDQGFGKNLYFNLSADYTIEEATGHINPARPFMERDGKTYWKRALAVEEANEYRKKYPWVNTRIVATNIDEFIRGLESPQVDVVTGYHGRDFAKTGYERISSENGEILTEVEALGDNGMPRFRFDASQKKWVRESEGKTKIQKQLADAIEDRGLQYAYYVKTCCQTGRCASCEGKCGALARDFNVKNATNRDTESVKYWQKNMRAHTGSEFGDRYSYQFAHLLKNADAEKLDREREQRQAIYQAGFDGDEDYEDVIAAADLIPLDERYRILQDGMRAAAGDGKHVEHSVALAEGVSNYYRKYIEYNRMQTEVGHQLKTIGGSPIKRYGTTEKNLDGVGKQVGKQIYLHKNYAYDVVPKNVYDKALELLREKYPDFQFKTIMYQNDENGVSVRFDEAPDFDTAREPIPGKTVSVDVTNGTVGDVKPYDYIWHHKWLWVKNDYKGFDVKESWEWSKLWLSVIRKTKNPTKATGAKNATIDNGGIANGSGHGTAMWNEQLRYFGLPIDGETVDYNSRTPADKWVSHLLETQEERANAPQAETSEDTSIPQVPATFMKYRFNNDDIVLDWGGGRYDSTQRFMEAEYPGLKLYSYDPFNRTKSHNDYVLQKMKETAATVVTVNNVLNVIASKEAQRSVVSESKKYLEKDGVAIFKIYQGDYSGIGEISKTKEAVDGEEISTSSWQNNLETAEYEPLISEYYKYTKVTGDYILASDSESALKAAAKNTVKGEQKAGIQERKQYFKDNRRDMKYVEESEAEHSTALDIEEAANSNDYPGVIRQGSKKDVEHSTALTDKKLNPRIRVNMATFFSGTGTVDFALRNIVRHEFAVELDPKIAAVYRANNGDRIYVDDVREVNIDKHKGMVEYFHASPVCKNYSGAKNNAEELPLDRETAQATADAIDKLQPKVVTVENVARYRNSEAIKIIEDALRRNGYTFDKGVYRASDFGGATIRERMFLRAVKDGTLPKIDTSEYTPMSWYDAVEDLIPELPKVSIPNFMAERLEPSGIDINNLKQPIFILGGNKGRRLSYATADKPAPTILANSHDARIVLPDGAVLKATPRVMARIQGLPDSFNLMDGKGGTTNAYRVVGNGVPVQLTQGIVGPLLEENLIKQKSESTGIEYSRSLTGGMSSAQIDQKLADLVKTYGALPKGENPQANVELPTQTSANKNTRRFARNVLESGVANAQASDAIKEMIIKEALSYEPKTDKNAAEYASSTIRAGGIERARREWDRAVKNGKIEKEDMALGQFLLKEYAKLGDTDKVLEMTEEISAIATRFGQNIQSLRLLKKYAMQDPAVGLGYIQRTVDQMNREAKRKMGSKYKEMRIDKRLANEYINAKTGDEIDAALGKIYINLGNQVQKTTGEEIADRLRAWRYLSMLGNSRTHIRNLVGNAIFVPAVRMKDAIGAELEKSTGASRTKALRATPESVAFAKKDAILMRDVLSGKTDMSIRDLIMEQRKVFSTNFLNKASKGNSELLEKEDWWFLRMHYVNALSKYITANNIDPNTIDGRDLSRAREYAIKEAQKATYRDANRFASWLNSGTKISEPAKFMIEGMMPFKKTPANILRRGVEYSPAGLIATATKGTLDLRAGKLDLNEYIDRLSAGLTGSAVFGLGMFLASTGLILGGYADDDDKTRRKLRGEQEYSVRIGDHTYTVDWAAPGSLPLFVGVETMCALMQQDITFSDIPEMTLRVIDPMINMSMLDGLNNTLEAISYSDHKLSAIVMENLYSLLGQFVPTIMGQGARIIDTTQRINYQDKNLGVSKDMLYFFEKIQNKIPFMSFKNDPYLNEFGQENVTESRFVAAFQNLVSPGYISKINDDKVIKELDRLSEAQEENVYPKKMDKYVGSGKDRKDLTSAEYTTYQRIAGQLSYNILDNMVDDKRYDSLTADQQAEAIKMAYSYAKAVGRIAIQKDYEEKLKGDNKKIYNAAKDNALQAYDVILDLVTK